MKATGGPGRFLLARQTGCQDPTSRGLSRDVEKIEKTVGLRFVAGALYSNQHSFRSNYV
jgi:hypothetical protein